MSPSYACAPVPASVFPTTTEFPMSTAPAQFQKVVVRLIGQWREATKTYVIMTVSATQPVTPSRRTSSHPQTMTRCQLLSPGWTRHTRPLAHPRLPFSRRAAIINSAWRTPLGRVPTVHAAAAPVVVNSTSGSPEARYPSRRMSGLRAYERDKLLKSWAQQVAVGARASDGASEFTDHCGTT